MPTDESSTGPYPTHVLTARAADGALRNAERHAARIDRREVSDAAGYPDPPPNWHASVPVDEYPATGGLSEWTADKGREDLALDAAVAAREQEERDTSRTMPDLYAVADAVLAPLMEEQISVPRRLLDAIKETLTARGVKPTRANQLKEAARMMAQDRAAADPEMSLALLMRAALLFKPEGGWQSTGPRKSTEGFHSVRALLQAAFSELRLGTGDINLDVAQSRARTYSVPGEVFISATHCGTANAKNAAAIERACDAQRIIAKANIHPADVRILFEKVALDRFKSSDPATERRALTVAVRARHARTLGVTLPAMPPLWGLDSDGAPKSRPKKPTPSEQDHADDLQAIWYIDAGIVLHGMPEASEDDAGAPSQATIEKHLRRRDGALLAALDEAENALRRAIGQERRGAGKKRRRVQCQIHGGA